jgi:hypothetical protein
MKRALILAAAPLLLALAAHGQAPSRPGEVPVKPIPPSTYQAWTNAYRLKNTAVEVIVVPAIGRIAAVRVRGGENLLRLDATPPADAEPAGTWHNYGGNWLCPVAQSRWTEVQGDDWPPSPLLDGRPWSGRAWVSANGNLCCVMTQEYGAPLHLKVSRQIRLDKDAPRVAIRQRVERTKASKIPVSLWSISQVADAGLVVMPADDESKFAGGSKPMMFGPPGTGTVSRCLDSIVYDVSAGGEHKLCSDSERAWIAASRGDTLLIERVTGGPLEGPYPDGGCTVEMYGNAGLGYAEIETLSREAVLEPGESLENVLHMEFHPLTTNRQACGVAEQVMTLLGERK